MVGVPRSKGCRICVQRRVKCDQTRPFCNNCKKGNRPCPGYGQDMKFQDEGPKLRSRYDKAPFPDEDETETSTDSSPPDSWTEVSTFHTPSLRSRSQPSSQPWDFTGLDTGPQGLRAYGWLEKASYLRITEEAEAPASRDDTGIDARLKTRLLSMDKPHETTALDSMLFSPNLQQQQLLSSWSDLIAPRNTPGLLRESQHHARWLAHLPPLTGSHHLLDTAVRAVTLAHLGRVHNSDTLSNESRPYYGKALRLLNTALQDQEKGMASETLSATILLSFYEMFSSESNESWVRHAGGAGTLMRIRGPRRHRYGFDREMFLAFRHALVIEAFQKDTACFLDSPEWIELGKQIHNDVLEAGFVGERLEIFECADAFFNEMVRAPGLLRDSRNLVGHAMYFGSAEAAKRDIVARALQLRSKLKSIFARFSAALRNLGHAPTSYMSGDPVIPVYYQYINIFIASHHTGYWTILILLNILLRELDPDSSQAGLYAMENREAALDCCRSEPFMEKSSFLGPFFVIFALRLSLAVLEPLHERQWVIGKLFHIGNTNMSMAKHMPSFTQVKPVPRVIEAVEAVNALEDRSSDSSTPSSDATM